MAIRTRSSLLPRVLGGMVAMALVSTGLVSILGASAAVAADDSYEQTVGNRTVSVTKRDYDLPHASSGRARSYFSAEQNVIWWSGISDAETTSDDGQTETYAADGFLVALDPETMEIVRTADVQTLTDGGVTRREQGIDFAVDDVNGLLWSVVDSENRVVIYDQATGARVGQIDGVGIPDGATFVYTNGAASIALDLEHQRAYVANPFGGTIAVIDTEARTVIDQWDGADLGLPSDFEFRPVGLVMSTADGEPRLYATNRDNYVDADGSERQVLIEIDPNEVAGRAVDSDAAWTGLLAVDPATGRILAGTSGFNTYDPATGITTVPSAGYTGGNLQIAVDTENDLIVSMTAFADLSTGSSIGELPGAPDDPDGWWINDSVAVGGGYVWLFAGGSQIRRVEILGELENPVCSTATAWVVGTPSVAGTITLKGVGWLDNAGTGGSVVAVKLDDGTYRNATGDVWTIIEANDDGTFEAEITLPTGSTDTSGGGSDPAYAAGSHWLRLLTGSLGDNDQPRSVKVPITVVNQDPDNPLPDPVDPGAPCVWPGSETDESAPAVTTQPADVTVAPGADAVFTVAASGEPEPTVQWQQSVDGGATWTPIEAATAATLTISAVTADLSGSQYRAEFSNTAGTVTSDPATLTVTEEADGGAPEITTQPAATTVVKPGGQVSFTAAASGDPTPTVQWYRDGAPIVGATGATYAISAAKLSDHGATFYAVFTNEHGQATTDTAILHVTSATQTVVSADAAGGLVLQIDGQGFPQPVTGGPPLSLGLIPSTSPDQAPDRGELIGNVRKISGTGEDRFEVVDGSFSTTLTIPAEYFEADKSYDLIVWQAQASFGTKFRATVPLTAEQLAALTDVATGPVITTQPEAVSAVVGESAALSVVASGEDLSYQWKRLWGSAFVPLFGQTDATLSFSAISAEDAGTYVVDVTNSDGTVTSQEVVVQVVSPFTDVALSHAFIDEIGWLASSGISTGYDNGDGSKSFRPSDAVLREQMAAFLYRLAGSPEVEVPEVSPFTDVPTDHAFYAAIVWLAQEGISTGYTEADGTTTFRPSQPVLREQMSAFLWRLAAMQDGADPAEVELAEFSDVPDEHVFAQEIAWLADSGITTGYDDGTFRPSQPVLREQMAAFLFRYNQLDG